MRATSLLSRTWTKNIYRLQAPIKPSCARPVFDRRSQNLFLHWNSSDKQGIKEHETFESKINKVSIGEDLLLDI